MKTFLIERKQPAVFDPVLLCTSKMTPATLAEVWSENLVLGIRNEQGDIYRVIGVSTLQTFLLLIQNVRRLGYEDDMVDATETGQGLDAIIFSPRRSTRNTS